MEADRLVGTWKLLSWRNEASDGSITHPMGEDAVGFLVYSNDGHVAAHLARRNRPRFALPDMIMGTPAECEAAMKTHISYVGTFDFDGETVVHHAALSSFPHWSGSDQVRRATFEGDTLLLSGEPMSFGGRTIVAHALWQRTAT